MSCGADTSANTLMQNLLAGKDFTVPNVELNSDNLKLPQGANSEMYSSILRLNISDLTQGKVGGEGAFDALMTSIRAHLLQEYEKGRITGGEYTKAYAELVAAINTAIAATPGAAGVSAKVGATFTEVNGVSVTGNYVVLSDAQGRAFTNGGFTHSENNTGRFTELGNFDTVDAIPVNQPVTATIVLDNVGRGSTGGDLVVGGLSVGDTSTSKGVQVFDITVERSSKLQNISSTNKSLEQVILKNGTTKGDVTVLGSVDDLDVTGPKPAAPAKTNTNTNTDVLPGSENHHDAYGLNDIRVLDASAMTGKVTVDAVLSSEVVKYMNRVDTQVDSNADDAQFVYTLGSNNDSLTLDISASNLEAAGATARDDFNLVISGGAGDDTITTDIIDPANLNEGNGAFW